MSKIDQSYIDDYIDLLIFQYSDKPKAKSEIEARLKSYSKIFSVLDEFINELDIDKAYGERLDLIGKIVGINRTIKNSTNKIYFGFDENPNAVGFGDAPFFDHNTDAKLTDTQLSDFQYQSFIKAKIIQNVATSKIAKSDLISLLNAYRFLLDNSGYILDNQDMSLTLYIDTNIFTTNKLSLLKAADLFVKPQAVSLDFVFIDSSKTFGFDENPLAVGFGDGAFAEQLFI